MISAARWVSKAWAQRRNHPPSSCCPHYQPFIPPVCLAFTSPSPPFTCAGSLSHQVCAASHKGTTCTNARPLQLRFCLRGLYVPIMALPLTFPPPPQGPAGTREGASFCHCRQRAGATGALASPAPTSVPILIWPSQLIVPRLLEPTNTHNAFWLWPCLRFSPTVAQATHHPRLGS